MARAIRWLHADDDTECKDDPACRRVHREVIGTLVHDPLGRCPACGVVNGEPHTTDCTLAERERLLAAALEQQSEVDMVNHPPHYARDDDYEPIKVIDAWAGPEAAYWFSIGNAIKYMARAGKKDPTKTVEDLNKAAWYLQHATELKEAEQRDAVR